MKDSNNSSLLSNIKPSNKRETQQKLFDDIIIESGNSIINLISDDEDSNSVINLISDDENEIKESKELFQSSGSSSSKQKKEQIIQKKTIDITYSNGNRYIGEVINDVRNGIGKFIWKDGNVYDGE